MSAGKVREIFIRSRRLAILRFLSEGAAYELNTSILQSALNASGLNSSRDAVEGECAWLEDQGFVSVERVQGTSIVVVHLTERGLEIAQGKAEHPGVDKPRPRRF
jgi:DNA-binding MarR family transcriptional regulator